LILTKTSKFWLFLVSVTFLQRITGKLKATFGYVPAGIPADQHLFSKWVPFTTELEANDSIEIAFGCIAKKITKVKNAIGYRSDLVLRYPTLASLCGRQPQIYIAEAGADVSFLSEGILLVQKTPTGFSIKGLNAEVFQALEFIPEQIDSATTDFVLNEQEKGYCKDGKNLQAFAEIWTLKEAFLKATGLGLVDDLPSIDVDPLSEENTINRNRWNSISFDCPGGEVGAFVGRVTAELQFLHCS